MTEFLDIQSGIITEYDDKLTRQLVERITLFDDKLQVAFRSVVDKGLRYKLISKKGNRQIW